MVQFAYRDEQREVKVFADEVSNEDMKTRFFCPNSACSAHMYICCIDGVTSAYFSATHSKYPHIKNCGFERSNGFKIENHDESLFDFNNAIIDMYTPNKLSVKKVISYKTGNSSKRPLKTIRQIYDMCKSLKYSDMYNNKLVGDMLLDERSLCMHREGPSGLLIIEAISKKHFYDEKKLSIYLISPIKSKEFNLQLKFNNLELFKDLRNRVYHNQDKIILIAGEWENTKIKNTFIVNVVTKKQFHIVL